MRPPNPRLFRHQVVVYPDASYAYGPRNEMVPVPGEGVAYRAIVSRASGSEAEVPGSAEYAATWKVMVIAAADPRIRVEQPMTWTDDVGVVRTLRALEESSPRNRGRFVVTAGYHGPDDDAVPGPYDGAADGVGDDDPDDPLLGEIVAP